MAKFHLAGCYRNGLGVDQDHTKAVEIYRTIADRGISQAQVALGRCYESGEGVDQSFTTAIEWYSKAADQANEDGRLHIVFLRGWFSLIGHDVEQSDETAFNYWHEVSTQSTDPVIKPIATHMLGWMHYLGRGTQLDKQKGVKIIRDNQSEDFPLGEQNILTVVYAEPWINSSPPAPRKLFELCQLGSDRDWLCRHLMAVCLVSGLGSREQQEKTIGIFENLASDGHNDSQLWIGRLYWRSWRVSRNHQAAFKWFRKAADQGNSYGEYMVGYFTFNGIGVPKDRTMAVEWFRKSAEQGNRYGQAALGYCYERGRGITKNLDTANFWYRKSADQGFQD
ncbi:uncharacterized protein BJ171DRAFT_444847, partial [Polychytrium aggregatum]|uniref:uncharacterized protein n=1 Tax=Polychytrium aggregatum TaxID=110093 RepID=UPI0022FF3CAE